MKLRHYNSQLTTSRFVIPIQKSCLVSSRTWSSALLTKRIADKLGAEAPVIEDVAPAAADAPEMPEIKDATYVTVRDAAELQTWIDQAYEYGYIAVDTETTGLNEMVVDLVGISLCAVAGHACYIPLAHKQGSDDLFGSDAAAEGQMPLQDALDMLKPMLEDESILKIGQNMKYDAKIFARYGVNIAQFDDTMLISYAQNAWVLKPQLHLKGVATVYETLERPLVPVLAQMEQHGVKVDRDTLSRMSNAFAQKMAGLEADIHELAGQDFNVGSPKQLGEILFDKLELPGGKKGKTGAYSTGVDILEDLATEHELPGKVLDWRQLSKLKSTYTDALQTHINADTGRVHTSYSIVGANTGRLSSSDPNLQNIPVRSEEGRRIREAFVAEQGNVLVSLDYSQIELRILAHVAEIDALKQAFKDGHDIHAMTASEMFDVPLDEMTPDIRRQAKAINFGVIYGISGFGLARNLRIPRSEAQGFIDRYFERFPGIRTYMDETVQFAKDHGYVQTLFGRKINTPEINAKGPGAGFAKRAAINAPIQGTAADVIRRAMIKMPAAISDLPCKMLLQVHDELIFEVPEDAVDKTISVVRDVMENASDPAVKFDVPLVVDAGQGALSGKADVTLRPERPEDFAVIRTLTEEAFRPKSYGDGTEGAIIDALRLASALTISTVALQNEEIVGHVAFSPATIAGTEGWYALGPVAVRLDFQLQGVGSQLIQDGLKHLKSLGALGCVLMGDPNYYGRFGFAANPALTYNNEPNRFVQAVPFTGGVPTGERGCNGAKNEMGKQESRHVLALVEVIVSGYASWCDLVGIALKRTKSVRMC
ncbi:DNA polymerase I [Nymphon striatum]|nr:DNA polymerase I [Nymphon striatum]